MCRSDKGSCYMHVVSCSDAVVIADEMVQETFTAFYNIVIGPVKIPGVPRVSNISRIIREVQQAGDLVVWI